MVEINAFGPSKIKSSEAFGTKELPVFGIDLGTTNSAISVIRNGKVPESIKLRSGKYTMPSCVMWHDGKFIVGDEAYVNRDKENVIYSVKRLMQDPTAMVKLKDRNDTIELTPIEVSSYILKGIVEQTDGFYGEIRDVVVTVPAYFNQNGISATRQACELAGLNLIAIANEPTAASLCYDLKPLDDGVKDVIIYDLGGGTFDVTLARITDTSSQDELASIYGMDSEDIGGDKIVTTLAIDGDTHLGGDDIDAEMLNVLFKRLAEKGIDGTKFKPAYKESLILRLENLKKNGVRNMYDVGIDTIDSTGHEIKCTIRITEDDFRAALVPVYEKTCSILHRLLKENKNKADTIVLVGGSTKNPLLVDMLRSDFPSFNIDNALNPDLSVSNGAAIQGKVTKFGDNTVQIFDILPLTIGILDDNAVNPIITKGTGLPTSASAVFTTVVDNQTDLTIELFQGNSSFKEECISLGTLTLTDITPRPAGEPNLSVTILISADRLMTCRASIDGITKELKLNLAGESKLTRKLSRNNKKLIRWQDFATKLDGKNKADFEILLDMYTDAYKNNSANLNEVEQQIKTFIREHREVGSSDED